MIEQSSQTTTAVRQAPATAIHHSGTVKWFSRKRGYGYIIPDDPAISDGLDVFVHWQGIAGEGYRNLYEGDQVTFTLHDFGKGPQARNVARRKYENGQGTRSAYLHA